MLTARLVLGSVAVVVVAAGAGACSNAPKDDVPRATVATAPTTSTPGTTTTVPDVSVIPAVIDEPYLNAVLAALDRVDGEATRLIVANKRFTREAAEILNAVYNDEEFEVQAEGWLQTIEKDPELKGVKPGDRKTTVSRLITASPDCVWVAVRRDYSATATTPIEPRVEYVALRPLDRQNDPRGRNPTAWMVTSDGFNRDGSEPGNQCVDG